MNENVVKILLEFLLDFLVFRLIRCLIAGKIHLNMITSS